MKVNCDSPMSTWSSTRNSEAFMRSGKPFPLAAAELFRSALWVRSRMTIVMCIARFLREGQMPPMKIRPDQFTK